MSPGLFMMDSGGSCRPAGLVVGPRCEQIFTDGRWNWTAHLPCHILCKGKGGYRAAHVW